MSEALVPLHRAAHARSGDKGNCSNISVIAWHAAVWPLLVEQITVEAIQQCFVHRRPSAVKRYLLPNLHAMNFVIEDVLDGGVNASLNLDTHGKSLSFAVLEIQIRVESHYVRYLVE